MEAMTNPSVLIIEDDPALRALESRLAERAGFVVRTAQDGPSGLLSAKTDPPDVVVSDFHMPGMLGPELLRRLRAIPAVQNCPIVVVTGDQSEYARKHLVDAGADDIIIKPFLPADFRSVLVGAATSRGLSPTPPRARPGRSKRDEEVRATSIPAVVPHSDALVTLLAATAERPAIADTIRVRNHIERVREVAAVVAKSTGAPDGVVAQLRAYAGLHDVGKSGLPDHILRCVEPYSAFERQEMETHTLIGADMLRDAGMPEMAIQIALHHHERWDGTGYPQRLAGDNIPFPARVVAVADLFDALRTTRAYRPDIPRSALSSTLQAQAGTALDPRLVAILLSLGEEIEAIYERYADPSSEPDPEVWA